MPEIKQNGVAKVGRPRWVPPDPKKVEGLARRGLTMEQIAASLGIGLSTLYRKRKQFREFGEAIKRGHAHGISLVANKLFKEALRGNVTAMIFFLKAQGGWREQADPVFGVNLNVGGANPTAEAREQDEQLRLIRALTVEERQEYLQLLQHARERLARPAVEAVALPEPEEPDESEVEEE